MTVFKIDQKLKAADTALHEYQAGEASDYEIICRDGSFGIHEHCLFSSEFLYTQHKGRKNLGENKENRTFNLKLFRKQSIKIAFDALYGLPNENIALHEMIELIAYLHFDGKIDRGSKFELEMYNTLIGQFQNNKEISRRTLSLVWIYFKAHAKEPLGLSIEPLLSKKTVWIFDRYDLKEAVMFLMLNDKLETNENDSELKKLISLQFEIEFEMTKWAADLFEKESDNLPKRLPKQPIYVHVKSEVPKIHQFTGKFNFHSMRSNAPVFVRDGGKLESFDPHPYYIAYIDDCWYVMDAKFFVNGDIGGYMKLETKETDYLSLTTTWKTPDSEHVSGWSEKKIVTLKMFANELEFKNYAA